MKGFLVYIWTLPQNLIGLLTVLILKAREVDKKNYAHFFIQKKRIGVSLGSYIILGEGSYHFSYCHEYGHHLQSLRLGWLYLPLVGLPSLCVNVYDRLFHKKWTAFERCKWYYSMYPEKWADKLGGVDRAAVLLSMKRRGN